MCPTFVKMVPFSRGAWVAQLVECLISAQVMISHSMSSSPASRSVLTAQSLEPASDSVSPSLSLCPSPTHSVSLSLSLSLSKIKKHKKIFLGAPGWLSRLSI